MTVFGRRIDVQTRANTIYGMLIVGFASSLLEANGAIAQYNGGSILQLMLGSYILQNVMAWAWWLIRKPSQAIHWYGDSPHKTNIWTRGLLYWIMMFCWWKGLEMVPIGDSEAILFVSPMLTVFLARVLLKEKLPRLFPLTLLFTIIGLLFVCQPEFIFDYTNAKYEQVSWAGMIFLVVCIFCWSTVSLLVRTAKEAHWLQVNLVTSFQAAWLWTPLLALINHYLGNNLGDGNGDPASNSDMSNVAWIDGSDFSDWDWGPSTMLTIIAMAFFEFFGVTCKVVGYQLGEATKVAAMEYINIVFAFLFEWFLFHKSPNSWDYIGGALLVTSCLVQLAEEKYWPTQDGEHSNGDSEDSGELETLIGSDKGEDGKKMSSKYGAAYDKWVELEKDSNLSMNQGQDALLGESSHMHVEFDGAYDVDTYKDQLVI